MAGYWNGVDFGKLQISFKTVGMHESPSLSGIHKKKKKMCLWAKGQK